MEQIRPTESKELQTEIHARHREVQQYILALKAENAKLQKRIIKLEAQNLSANNRIAALEQHLKEIEHHHTPSLVKIESLDKLASVLADSLTNRSSDQVESLSTKT